MSCMLVLIDDFSHISVTAEILSGILFYQLFIISLYHCGYIKRTVVVF